MALHHLLAMGVALATTSPQILQQREAGSIDSNGDRGEITINCGTNGYDDGSAEDALFFGGGNAGNPDFFLGVMFMLEDFGLTPGQIELEGFCTGNSFNLTTVGGPWPNEVFVYRDIAGLPDLDNPLRQSTIITGDGSGDIIVNFEVPALISSNFWIMSRGFPPHTGEDFNMESDQSSEPAERSYVTDRGLPFFIQTAQNLLLRAQIRIIGAPQAIPTLSLYGWICMVLMLMLLGWRRLHRWQQ
ncbi:MAG: hypothetical protein Tsb002_17750 [Wenzhouxiangellaceae bacterium]